MSTTTRTDSSALAGIVLAGGLSSRMGQDKARLLWEGRSLLEHMCLLLDQAGARPVRVSGDYPEFDAVPDKVPRCGPLGGLYSAVDTLEEGPAWVVPVDMPRLSVPLLARLRDAGPAPCVIFSGQPLPMRLNIDDACRTVLASMVQQQDGPRSLYALQQRLGVLELPVSADAAPRLVNCNTPAQWEEVAS
jgi:molybdopterin-guanine dinucleotide biosynthesis protein A